MCVQLGWHCLHDTKALNGSLQTKTNNENKNTLKKNRIHTCIYAYLNIFSIHAWVKIKK